MLKGAMTPAEHFESARTRKRRVALLNDVAQRMIVQSEREEQSASKRHEQRIKEERRRHACMLREAKMDRKAFQHAMARSTDVMMAAVEALREVTSGHQVLVVGDSQALRGNTGTQSTPQPSCQQEDQNQGHKQPGKSNSGSRKKSSRANAGKQRQRFDL